MSDFLGRSGNAGFGHPTPPLFPDPVVSAGSIYKFLSTKKNCAFSTRLLLDLKKRLENKTKRSSKVRFNLRTEALVGGAKKTKERPRNRDFQVR